MFGTGASETSMFEAGALDGRSRLGRWMGVRDGSVRDAHIVIRQ